MSARDFGRLEGKVDALLTQTAQIDARLRRLEEGHDRAAGRRSIVSAAVSAVVAFVVAWASKHV